MATIVLGISASIAAYKAADLASRLVKAGHDVYAVMTPAATKLLGPATLVGLTSHPVAVEVFDESFRGEITHIHLATIADLIVIAPATMDVMARIASGRTDDALTAIVSASKAPVIFAPGMNSVMWDSPANQANLATLAGYGYEFVDPVSGRLACRTVGVGKMAEPIDIHEAIDARLARRTSAAGKRVLVTAGPTREPIDAVRYISNRSSGKMGYAIAEAAARRGATVELISGPTALAEPCGVTTVHVTTAEDMRNAVLERYDASDVVIAAAAVADFTPQFPVTQKIKKTGEPLAIMLGATQDILAELGRRKEHQVLVGFAAETDDVIANAQGKLAAKNLDYIVANDVSQAGAGFDIDTNIVTILSRTAEPVSLPMMSKRDVAESILDTVLG
ncbi:MAG TPA: bifunctional phosphopantothenoylcysteine decarboxylase/phosphopantothenate--cysteine ligase CoaBC [Capsulimonadaceae bacterium]|jgi:phosphopantothenoylcysteine decarboxylase/phosphopantothenate--cysteine ligase